MSDEPFDEPDELPFEAEAIAAALAHTGMAQGDATSVTALVVSVRALK
jgi:hypothetical protein